MRYISLLSNNCLSIKEYSSIPRIFVSASRYLLQSLLFVFQHLILQQRLLLTPSVFSIQFEVQQFTFQQYLFKTRSVFSNQYCLFHNILLFSNICFILKVFSPFNIVCCQHFTFHVYLFQTPDVFSNQYCLFYNI